MSNITNTTYLLTSEEAIFLVIFTSLQSIIGAIANAVEIFCFLRMKREHKSPGDKFILNLAVADFMALTTYVPWRAYLLNLRSTTKNYLYYTSLFVVCIFCTGNAVLLVAFDRFVAITRPLRYHALMTDKVVWSAAAMAWITAIVFGIGHGLSYSLKIHSEYELFLSSFSFGQLIFFSFIYYVVFRSAKRQAFSISTLNFGSSNVPERNRAYILKTVRTTFSIVLLFYGTFLPYSVYRIVSTLDESLSKNSKRITWRWLIAFTFLNSCINPFIYFFGLKRFRSNLREVLFMHSLVNLQHQ